MPTKKNIQELIQQKEHHEHKATVHRGRFIHHWRKAREITKQLDEMAEVRRKGSVQ